MRRRRRSFGHSGSRLRHPILHPFEQGGLAFEFGGEGLEGGEGLGADVVLHALDILVDRVLVEVEEAEESGEALVAAGDGTGDALADFGEDDPTVFLVDDHVVGVEPLDHFGHAGLGDAEIPGHIDDARGALFLDELEDLLEVVVLRA